ncbi:MAG: hypothetical protein U0Q19_01190 [Kineosporiaceae bacterium]
MPVTFTTADDPGDGAQAPPLGGAAGAVVVGGVDTVGFAAVGFGAVGAGLPGGPDGALPDGATLGAPAVGDGDVMGCAGCRRGPRPRRSSCGRDVDRPAARFRSAADRSAEDRSDEEWRASTVVSSPPST